MAHLSYEGGSVCLQGSPVDRAALSPAHCKICHQIILFTKEEIAEYNINVKQVTNSLDVHFVDLGKAGKDGVYFKVVVWPGGAQARASLGLPPRQFHIMLSDVDDNTIDKGPNSIFQSEAISSEDVDLLLQMRPKSEDVLKYLYIQQPSERLFDSLCSSSNCAFMLKAAKEHPEWCLPFLKLGLFYYKYDFEDRAVRYKCAMIYLLLARKRAMGAKVVSFLDERLHRVSKYTEWGCICTEQEIMAFTEQHFHREFLKEVLHACPLTISLSERYRPELQLESRVRMLCPTMVENHLEFTKLPRFFRWVLPFKLAVMSAPRNVKDIELLSRPPFLFNKIVTLTEEDPLPSEWCHGLSIENVFLPLPNYKAPTKAQVNQFIDIVTAGHCTLVHCGGGKGRAGTFIACYLATCGFTLSRQQFPVYAASEVISMVRHFRPGSIETEKQECFIEAFIASLWKQQVEPCCSIKEPHTSLVTTGLFDKSVKLIVLCGLQGAGKSTFAQHMKDALRFTVISQDDVGSKSACEAALAAAVRKDERVIVDKCNVTVQSRKDVLEIAYKPKSALCIFFDYVAELCIQRADARVGHPTIPQGRATVPVKSMEKILVPPTLSEGFTCIVTVQSIHAADDLLARFVNKLDSTKVDEGSSKKRVVKFPRTRHMYNLGSATRDDLIMTQTEACGFLSTKDPDVRVVVQEKIDGANLGISIDVQTMAFHVQNRSHFVNSKSHTQFKKLDLWLQRRKKDLWYVLTCNDTLQPGRLVLFGEWVFAKHSIHYARLPDVFIAFDIYDTKQKQFYSSVRVRDILRATGLSLIHQIDVDYGVLSQEAVEQLVLSPSVYYDGMVEGVYLRRETDMWTVDRAKVVRPDFICGNAHWSKGRITENNVVVNVYGSL